MVFDMACYMEILKRYSETLRLQKWSVAERMRRTADSGSAYRGSNPWGAAKSITYDPRKSPMSLTGNISFANVLEST